MSVARENNVSSPSTGQGCEKSGEERAAGGFGLMGHRARAPPTGTLKGPDTERGFRRATPRPGEERDATVTGQTDSSNHEQHHGQANTFQELAQSTECPREAPRQSLAARLRRTGEHRLCGWRTGGRPLGEAEQAVQDEGRRIVNSTGGRRTRCRLGRRYPSPSCRPPVRPRQMTFCRPVFPSVWRSSDEARKARAGRYR
jgi:hypothetical protein